MTVLVGVDGSDGGRTALRWAAGWATSCGAPLVAVTTWQYPRTAALPGGPSLGPPGEMDQLVVEDLRSTVVDVLGEASADVETVVERGPAAWAILNLAARREATMLVVGRRGLGALEGRLLGSVSRRVAELAPCPVAIVPGGLVDGGVDGGADGGAMAGPIVVGVDGSPAAAVALGWAIDAARSLGTGIVVAHGLAGLPAEVSPGALDGFVGEARALVDRHATRVSEAGVDVTPVVRVDDPRTVIGSVADEHDARMVVVGSKGDGPVSGLLIGSVVNHVAQLSDRPVVIVPREAE